MARLLTPEEIRQLPRTSIVWIEFYNAEESKSTYIMASMKCADGTLVSEDLCMYEEFEEDVKPSADGWWRFWDGEPTDQEREEEPWTVCEG